MNEFRFFKKGLLLLCLFATGFLLAQQEISTDYATQTNTIFAGMSKTRVPNGLLLDYAMEFAELSAFNGATLTNENTVTTSQYTDIYNTLLMARVQTTVPGLVAPTVFKSQWDNLRQANKIVLSGLYYKYSQFKANANPSLLTVSNNKYFDKFVNGVWQNPYEDKLVFAMTTPLLKYNSLSVQVVLPSSLFYTNQNSNVSAIAIDFGNGQGYQNITRDQIVTINFAQSGNYEWKYKLTTGQGQILYSHSKIIIEGDDAQTRGSNARTVNQARSIQCPLPVPVSIMGTRQYLGQVGSATLQIRYATDCQIRKPLIVVEGFDSGLAGKENEFGESSFRTFNRESLDDTGLLGASLDTYDIIYVNWNNGKDYLQRNAYVLEDVIKYVNTRKASAGSTIPNVIIGQSMGGVIARYALRDMENLYTSTGLATWQHKTNLYVSHDAPQQGANIPLGILYLARHLSKQFINTPLGGININPSSSGGSVTIADLESLIDAPGTQQLLKYSIGSNYAVTNSLSSSWQTELQNMGYPQQTRNIAISNGNHCANPQAFAPGAKLFSLNGFGKTSFLTDFLSILLSNVSGASYGTAAILLNEPGLLLGVLPGRSKFNLDFQVNALPNIGTTAQIYKGKISFTKTLLWIAPITINLTNKSFSSFAGSLPLDYYPGGMYSLDFDFQNTSASNAFGSFVISSFLEPSFGFIPEPSALDIGRGNTTLDNSDYLKKYSASIPLVAPKDSPFANYTTSFSPNSNLNEEHISFNTRNGDWLAAELNAINNVGIPQIFNCTYVCSNTSITGLDAFCTSATYSAASGATTYNWTLTQGANLVNLSANGASNIILTALPNASGQVTLSLTLGGTCGAVTIIKNILVGVANTSYTLINNTKCEFQYKPIYSDPTTTYFWEYISGTGGASNVNEMNLNQYDNNLFFNCYESFTVQFKLTVTNACGSVIRFVTDLHTIDTGPPYCALQRSANSNEPQTIFKIYPNPSKEVVNIELTDKTNMPITKSEITGELFDIMGQSKRKVQIKNNTASLPVAGLAKGIYVLNITIDGKAEGHQVIVE
jgi:hypothetical protein